MRNLIFSLALALMCPALSLSGQLRINEFLTLNNFNTVNPVTGQPGDWIELYNEGTEPVSLIGYFLSDNPDLPTKWKLPSSISVQPGEYLLIFADGEEHPDEELHANFRLESSGEYVLLYSAADGMIDSIRYPRQFDDVSYGLNQAGELAYFDKCTPGAANDESSAYQISSEVTFDPPGGIYRNGMMVKLRGTEGGVIHYTTDGSEPEWNDPIADQLEVRGSMVIRARQFESGKEPSEVSTSTYIIHIPYNLPVISLATNPDNFFDDEIGIYVRGTNGITGNCNQSPVNWNQPWERPVSFEYFSEEGQLALQADLAVKIHGGCSRNADLKSLGFMTRSAFGEPLLEYPFFRQKNIDEYKGLILRNAGNDNNSTFLRDAVIMATVEKELDVDVQAYEPVHVYLNGDYWGIHNLREKVNEHWVTSNYGIPQENLDFLKNYNEVFAGNEQAFNQLWDFMENNSLALEPNYQKVAAQLDIPSYIDYLITQMYFANDDWPGNNVKYWRDRTNGGKWRFILFDLEFGLGMYGGSPSQDMFAFVTEAYNTSWPNPHWSTLPMRSLFKNKGFRDEFLGRYMMLLNTVFQPENVNRVIDSLQNRIYPDFHYQVSRWNGMFSSISNWENQVEGLRRYAELRPDNVWQNMAHHFSLGDPVELRVDNENGKGDVLVNGVAVPRGQFTGQILPGINLKLEYRGDPGYRLSHWVITTVSSETTTLLPRNSNWRYNDSGTLPGNDWYSESYDDASWKAGNGELGYGEGDEGTELEYGPNPSNKYLAYYFRTELELENVSSYDWVRAGILRDDGVVLYVNGQEVLRDNMPEGEITDDTESLTFVGGDDENTYFEFNLDPQLFRDGTNILAVEVHQSSGGSSDLSFDMELQAGSVGEEETKTLTGNPLEFQAGHGMLIQPFSEEIELELDLHINEFMSANRGVVLDEYGQSADWVEIYNAGDQAVDLAGLYMTDSLDDPTMWQIPYGYPEETTIEAGAFKVLYADGNKSQGPLHLDFRISAGGESVGLSYLSGSEVIWIDSVSYQGQPVNYSLGRYPDGSEHWKLLADCTPGESNLLSGQAIRPVPNMQVSLYPNPASSLLHVQINNPDDALQGEVLIRVFDMTGREVLNKGTALSGRSMEEDLDIAHLANGMYLIRVDAGRESYSGRFVKASR